MNLTDKKFIDSPSDKEELWPLVVKECKLIKDNFTSEEINKLDLEDIDPTNSSSCIYGRMIGNCNNPRVEEFIQNNLDTLIKTLNFDKLDKDFNLDLRATYFVTPLEEYIFPTDEEDNEYYDNYYDGPKNCTETVLNRIERVLQLLK